MDFSLSDEHRMIQQSIRKFCERELDPIAGEIDRSGRFPMMEGTPLLRFRTGDMGLTLTEACPC